MEQFSQIVDKASAMERLDHDEELYQEILALFLADYPSQIQNLQYAIDLHDQETSHRVAHSMKSAAGNVGAITVSNVARDIERAAQNGDMLRVEQLFSELQAELEKLQAYIVRMAG